MTLRELRLFHWRQVIAFRNAANAMSLLNDPSNQVDHLHKNANFHLAAVQALNDVVMITGEGDDTAERDEERSNGRT